MKKLAILSALMLGLNVPALAQSAFPLSSRASYLRCYNIPANAGGEATVEDHADLRLTGNLTIEVWVKVMNNAGNPVILNKGSGGDITYNIYLSSGTVNFYQSGQQVNGGPLPLGEWAFLTITKSGTTAKVYINGVETASDTIAVPNDNTDDLLLLRDSAGNRFLGSVRNLAIWKGVVRTPAQIAADMVKPPTSGTGLVAFYKCDGAVGDTELVDSVGGHDGTLSSGGVFVTDKLPR